MLAGYIDIGVSRGRPGMALYDPTAAVAFVRPDLLTFRQARIDVELNIGLTRGRTVVETRPTHAAPNAEYAVEVRAGEARTAILAALTEAARR